MDQTSANQLVDSILNSLKTTYAEKLEPIKIPKFSKPFSRSVLGIRFRGRVTLLNGTVNGVSNLYRASDASLGPLPDTGEIAASVKLGLNNVKVVAEVHIELNRPGINTPGSLVIEVEHIELQATVVLRASTFKPSVEKLELVELRGVNVRFAKPGITGGIINKLIKILVNSYMEKLRSVIEKKMNKAVTKALAKKSKL